MLKNQSDRAFSRFKEKRTCSRACSRKVCNFAGIALAFIIAIAPLAAPAQTGDFDYLALTLSWSPTYCASQAGRDDTDQCRPGRRFAFVVHGLWPQYDRGWPQYCETAAPFVPEETIEANLDIMPSKRLIIQQWRKHGACFGTAQSAYFAATRNLFTRVRIPDRYIAPQSALTVTPDDLIADFVSANAWLEADMISVQCGNQRDTARLRELRLCFGRKLDPIECGVNERRACRARRIVLPPVR